MKIILASSSRYRKHMFNRLGFEYQVKLPDFEEIETPGIPVQQQIESFAYGKAKSVFDTLKTTDDMCILGFDTVVDLEGQIIGKQKTKKSVFEMIQSYRGKKVEFLTSVAMMGYYKGKKFEEVFSEKSFVSFRSDITNCQIRAYTDFGDWKHKGGGFSINGPAIFLIDEIEGDFHTIIGVPMRRVGRMIERITGKRIFNVLKPAKRREIEDGLL